MRHGGPLLTQADNSHPMAFWPLEAKRLGINFSNLSLIYPFFPFILPLLPPSCGSWSTCCSDNSLTLPQKTEKLEKKPSKAECCPQHVLCSVSLSLAIKHYKPTPYVERRDFSLLSNNSIPDQTVWTTKPCWPSRFLVDHHSPKAPILN